MKQHFETFRTAWKLPRWRSALLIAVVSDALGFAVVMLPLAQWLLDAATAVALLAALGFRWQLFTALAIEVVPALELFPAWTLFVLATAGTTIQRPLDGKSSATTEPPEHRRRAQEP